VRAFPTTGFCTDSLHSMRSSRRCKFASRANSLWIAVPQVYVAHRGFNVIVSGGILQRQGVPRPRGGREPALTVG
jgi:hypothetical protein